MFQVHRLEQCASTKQWSVHALYERRGSEQCCRPAQTHVVNTAIQSESSSHVPSHNKSMIKKCSHRMTVVVSIIRCTCTNAFDERMRIYHSRCALTKRVYVGRRMKTPTGAVVINISHTRPRAFMSVDGRRRRAWWQWPFTQNSAQRPVKTRPVTNALLTATAHSRYTRTCEVVFVLATVDERSIIFQWFIRHDWRWCHWKNESKTNWVVYDNF